MLLDFLFSQTQRTRLDLDACAGCVDTSENVKKKERKKKTLDSWAKKRNCIGIENESDADENAGRRENKGGKKKEIGKNRQSDKRGNS